MMCTNIGIDDTLLAKAMAGTIGLRTKRKVIEAGLRLLARHKPQSDAGKLFGRIRCDGDPDHERFDAVDS